MIEIFKGVSYCTVTLFFLLAVKVSPSLEPLYTSISKPLTFFRSHPLITIPRLPSNTSSLSLHIFLQLVSLSSSHESPSPIPLPLSPSSSPNLPLIPYSAILSLHSNNTFNQTRLQKNTLIRATPTEILTSFIWGACHRLSVAHVIVPSGGWIFTLQRTHAIHREYSNRHRVRESQL